MTMLCLLSLQNQTQIWSDVFGAHEMIISTVSAALPSLRSHCYTSSLTGNIKQVLLSLQLPTDDTGSAPWILKSLNFNVYETVWCSLKGSTADAVTMHKLSFSNNFPIKFVTRWESFDSTLKELLEVLGCNEAIKNTHALLTHWCAHCTYNFTMCPRFKVSIAELLHLTI